MESAFLLPVALQHMTISGDRTASDLQASLTSGIRRHGCFSDPAATLDFVASALMRAERRIDCRAAFQRAVTRSRRYVDGGLAAQGAV